MTCKYWRATQAFRAPPHRNSSHKHKTQSENSFSPSWCYSARCQYTGSLKSSGRRGEKGKRDGVGMEWKALGSDVRVRRYPITEAMFHFHVAHKEGAAGCVFAARTVQCRHEQPCATYLITIVHADIWPACRWSAPSMFFYLSLKCASVVRKKKGWTPGGAVADSGRTECWSLDS